MADLSALRDAGIDVDSYSEEERTALEGLSDEEVAALAAIRTKLNSGGDDELRSARADNGNIVW
ncbi:MAG: hypothetical protein QOJ35_156 [Solirubrobacteraceae bacterium]|jgi:hypothetical protein|nr:hypothetical protein [Solirubrobacteraceae bacterium]